ncbi:hypothetical protein CK203_115376 [Vitis vinifera]|uniref:Retrovirus-related Pol polyprotein from transposon RE1 n=1 Tax=Vitis vinifera TaxID=29760 RepID=A0A438D1N6_VITVI|nr:hypothetical protein CK203_115376 [Vitis vinifera]
MASFNKTSESPSASTVNVQNPLSQSNNLHPPVNTPSFSFPSMNQPLIVKLDNRNYLIWNNQLLNVIITNELDDFIDGSRHCPPRFLDLQQQIINPEFTLPFMALVTELHTKLQTLRKDELSTSEYIQKLKSICNSLAAIGKPVYEKEHLIYLFNGLERATHYFTPEINMLDTVTPFSVSDQVTVGNGLEVHCTPIGIHLSQAKYITNLFTRAAMLDAKPCPTPMSFNTNFSLHDGMTLENGSDYRSFVGVLNLPWTSTSLAIQMPTRPLAPMTGVAPVATASFLAPIWFLGHLPNKKWYLDPTPNQVPRGSK